MVLTLHQNAQQIISRQEQKRLSSETLPFTRTYNERLKRKLQELRKRVFQLPSLNGANKILAHWVASAGTDKHITWSCARLSFSILLQDRRVDLATVAYLLGHTTTKQVQKAYKRHRAKSQSEVIALLPSMESIHESTDKCPS